MTCKECHKRRRCIVACEEVNRQLCQTDKEIEEWENPRGNRGQVKSQQGQYKPLAEREQEI